MNGKSRTPEVEDYEQGLGGSHHETRKPPIDEKALAEWLKKRIYGQDELIDRLAHQLCRRLAARRRPSKPLAIMLFVGPPGVGKTSLAIEVAEAIYRDRNHLLMFGMGELGYHPHTVCTLFGTPPGWLGGEGVVTTALRRTPNAIVLLDDIEKCHPEVLNRFLPAWSYGTVTDQLNGAECSLEEAVFILTCNAKHREIAELGDNHTGGADDLEKKLKGLLGSGDYAIAPEVLSRIDAVFAFQALEAPDMARVAARQIELLAREYGLGVSFGIPEEILLLEIEMHQRTGKGGVRDIYRAIEFQVADGMIDAKSGGAKAVRFVAEGGRLRVVPVKAAD